MCVPFNNWQIKGKKEKMIKIVGAKRIWREDSTEISMKNKRKH